MFLRVVLVVLVGDVVVLVVVVVVLVVLLVVIVVCWCFLIFHYNAVENQLNVAPQPPGTCNTPKMYL